MSNLGIKLSLHGGRYLGSAMKVAPLGVFLIPYQPIRKYSAVVRVLYAAELYTFS